MKKLIIALSLVLLTQVSIAANLPFLQYKFAIHQNGTDLRFNTQKYLLQVFNNGGVYLYNTTYKAKMNVNSLRLNQKALRKLQFASRDLHGAKIKIERKAAVCEIFVTEEQTLNELYLMKDRSFKLIDTQEGCFMPVESHPITAKNQSRASSIKFALHLLGLQLLK